MRVLIIGCGYVGGALASALRASGTAVCGTSRTASGCAALVQRGFDAARVDLADGASIRAACADRDAVVLLAGAGRAVPDAQRAVYLEGARHLAAAVAQTPVRHVVQGSSTGVYGQADGSWVDETATVGAGSPRCRLLADAERVLRSAAPHHVIVTRLRIGGIHGPDRRLVDRVARSAGAVRDDGAAFVNLVHREDVVRALLAVLQDPRDTVYNVTDGEPVTRRVLYDRLLSAARLPAVDWRTGSGGLGKRVDSRRIGMELAVTFEHRALR